METELYSKVMTLSELLWENRVNDPALERWLGNFKGFVLSEELERAHALYLLSRFLYFGEVEIRHLLRALFDDLVRQPLAMQVREDLGGTTDSARLHEAFLVELGRTRFCGIGGASKSGAHLVYPFRQENDIPPALCCSVSELFVGASGKPGSYWADAGAQRIVLLDDFCATGQQAIGLLWKLGPQMRKLAEASGVTLQIWYFPLVATTEGLAALREAKLFDRVEAVAYLDDTYKVFHEESQFYTSIHPNLEKADAEAMLKWYGARIDPVDPLGFGDSQLLVGFRHNVPDNTVPIMWKNTTDPLWYPVFPRIE